MSKMSDLMITIEEMLMEGASIQEVAKFLHIPLEWVESVAKTLGI